MYVRTCLWCTHFIRSIRHRTSFTILNRINSLCAWWCAFDVVRVWFQYAILSMDQHKIDCLDVFVCASYVQCAPRYFPYSTFEKFVNIFSVDQFIKFTSACINFPCLTHTMCASETYLLNVNLWSIATANVNYWCIRGRKPWWEKKIHSVVYTQNNKHVSHRNLMVINKTLYRVKRKWNLS